MRETFLCRLSWLLAMCLLVALVTTGCKRQPTLSPTATRLAPPTPSEVATASPTPQRPTATPTLARPTVMVPTPATLTPAPTYPPEPMLLKPISLGELPTHGESPGSVALMGGRAYVVNSTSANVSIIEDGRVQTVVAVGSWPGKVLADAATKRVYVPSNAEKAIRVLEGTKVTATWSLPDNALSLALAEGGLWASVNYGGRLLILSPDDGTIKGQVELPQESRARVLIGGVRGRLYGADYGGVTAIDTLERKPIAHVKLEEPQALALSPDGGTLYATNYQTATHKNTLVSLAAETLMVSRSVPGPDYVSAIATDPRDGRIYVLSRFTHQVMIFDPQDLRLLGSYPVGRYPTALSLDEAQNALLITNTGGDNLVVFDLGTLRVRSTVPLATNIEDLEVDPISGRLYAAVSSANQILVIDAGEVAARWAAPLYPSAIRVVPGKGTLAVLSEVESRVALFDQTGRQVGSYATGTDPRGLEIDEIKQRLYAGGTIIELGTGSLRTVRIRTANQMEVTPVGVVMDTRRRVPYAVAGNGVPGSNGGFVVTRLTEDGVPTDKPAPGRLSVIDLVYDEEQDLFYCLYGRMFGYGLVVNRAEDASEVLNLALPGWPAALALNPATRHLWVSIQRSGPADTVPPVQLVAFDTRTFGRAITLTVDGPVDAMAADPRTNRVYAAAGLRGAIYVVQDVPMAPAPSGVATVTPVAKTVNLPTVPPTPAPRPTCPAATDPRLAKAWASAGGHATLGCALGAADVGDWAIQKLERGEMHWYAGATTIFMLRNDGTYRTYKDTWKEGLPALSCDAQPPSGLEQPRRGFGLVWCREAGVRDALGWAKGREQAARAVYQRFMGGAIFMPEGGTPVALHNDGRWQAVPE